MTPSELEAKAMGIWVRIIEAGMDHDEVAYKAACQSMFYGRSLSFAVCSGLARTVALTLPTVEAGGFYAVNPEAEDNSPGHLLSQRFIAAVANKDHDASLAMYVAAMDQRDGAVDPAHDEYITAFVSSLAGAAVKSAAVAWEQHKAAQT